MATYTALMDVSTSTILAVGNHAAAVVLVNECTLDSVVIPVANLPKYRQDFFLAKLEPEQLPNWSWNNDSREFIESPVGIRTERLRQRARLATEKMWALSFMMLRLNTLRLKVGSGVNFQELIYLGKQIEARRLKDSDYDEHLVMESPYVAQYASYSNISIEQACDEILLHAKIDHEFLAKTENVRMKYFTKVKRANTVEEVRTALKGIRRET